MQITYFYVFKLLKRFFNRKKYSMRMREKDARLNAVLDEIDDNKLIVLMKTKEINE